MGIIVRGVKNAFRNLTRTFSVALILAISIGLALIMFISYTTVEKRIVEVRSKIGNTITITPAGVQGFEGGGEPLTDAEIDGLATIKYVASINKLIISRTTSDITNLVSAIEAGTLGRRFNDQNRSNSGSVDTSRQINERSTDGISQTFSPPINLSGISNQSMLITGDTVLASGSMFFGSEDSNVAVMGLDLANKNNLSIGSTFSLYGESIELIGIYQAENKFANNGVYLPIKTLQKLSSQEGEVNSATVLVNSIENVSNVVEAVKLSLGSDKVDIVSNLQNLQTVIAPLENIKKISAYSLIGALVGGAIIILLIMIMVVRERRKELGVLKAIGSSNIMIIYQFVVESMVLTIMGAFLGVIIGVAFANPVLNVMVNNSSANVAQTEGKSFENSSNIRFSRGGEMGGGRLAQAFIVGGQSVQSATSNLKNNVGLSTIFYGFLVAVLISIIGSAIPAWLIAKVRPAEVMRGE